MKPNRGLCYGICPAQVEGISSDGRPFYFRSRNRCWTIDLGEQGWPANICGWPDGVYPTQTRIAFGEGEVIDPDEVDALIDEHVGVGWRQATPEESLYDQQCIRCGHVFRSDGSNICTECLVNKILRKG